MLSSDVMATDDEPMGARSTGFSPFAILNVSSATGLPQEMVGSARGVNGQGRVLHPSVAAVETGPNGRAPFWSSTRALAGLVAGWNSRTENEMQGFSSKSSRTGRSHELQIPVTLEGRTWGKRAFSLSFFASRTRQSSSLWVMILWYEHHICLPPLCCHYPPQLRLISLVPASLLVLPSFTSPILPMNYLKVGAVLLIGSNLLQ